MGAARKVEGMFLGAALPAARRMGLALRTDARRRLKDIVDDDESNSYDDEEKDMVERDEHGKLRVYVSLTCRPPSE